MMLSMWRHGDMLGPGAAGARAPWMRVESKRADVGPAAAKNAKECAAAEKIGAAAISGDEYFRSVHADLVQALLLQRPQIVTRWGTYLRMQPVVSALARPDTLMFGVDGVLDEVFARLKRPPTKRPVRRWADHFCGRNPLRAFYSSGEQALLETLVIVQTSLGRTMPRERTVALEELRQTIRAVARRDLEGLASLCRTCVVNATGTGRCPAEGCRAGWSARAADPKSRLAGPSGERSPRGLAPKRACV